MKTIFMTSPANFNVDYSINPWMEGNAGSVNTVKAAQQWSELRTLILHAGQYNSVDVIVLPRTPEYCPDAVFTANAGLIYKNKFLPSRFRFEERAAEEPFFTNWFKNKNFQIVDFEIDRCQGQLRSNIAFEGAGDALFNSNKNILWFGFGFRSTFAFKTLLDKFFDNTEVIVRPLLLVDPRFYHLDTCFFPTDTGHLIWYPPAFSEFSQYIIRSWYEGEKSIEVSEQDALNFACNGVSIGSSLIMPLISEKLEKQLLSMGFVVGTVDMSEFMKSGGSCKCLTLEMIE